nr:FAD-dependent oxidoreductase [uncultured Oscillibacter sp.]
MYHLSCDVAVIGGGPAGLAAAAAAKKQGAGRVVIIERDTALGGILQQCIHPGFGLKYYGEELTGPEYAGRFIDQVADSGIELLLDTMVLEIRPDRSILCASASRGMIGVRTKSLVLAMGCRERTRASIQIPGTRPAGVYTAGAAQRLLNRQNTLVGKKIVILGSGDIGMIMARRMSLEGAKVEAIVEIMPYLAGLTRNRVQCVDDFGIPLLLSHTIAKISGNERVESVTIQKVDERRQLIPGTEQVIPCDTLLLSVGLIPENELTQAMGIVMDPITNGPQVNQLMQTSVPWVFACGNVLHVNDLVDNVTGESEHAGRQAARLAMGEFPEEAGTLRCLPGSRVRYICPQFLRRSSPEEEVTLYFRVTEPMRNVELRVRQGERELARRKALRVSPGEMEHFTLSCGDISGEDLTVEVIKEGVQA